MAVVKGPGPTAGPGPLNIELLVFLLTLLSGCCACPAAVTCNDGEVIVEDWLIQPIAADIVADVLVEATLGQTHTPRTITGPHAIRLPELTSKLLSRQGDGRHVRAVQPAVAALGTGALLASDHAVVVGPDVDTWLHTLAPAGTDGSQGEDGSSKTRRS